MRVIWLVVVVAACSSGKSSSGNPDAAETSSAAQQFCVSETNRYRAMASKGAIAESTTLEVYADTGAMVDFTTAPHHHFSTTSGGGIALAENECPVQGNWMLDPGIEMSTLVGKCIAAFYAEGPGGGHYDNMMSDNASLGCGTYQVGAGVTIVQDYGP